MTQKVNPSFNRPAGSFETAGAIALAGGSSDGWISETPSEISVQNAEITDGNLNSFAETNSSSSFDVTIDGGEAFVYGSWLAIDTTTTVTLASSTTDQTVYVGWSKDTTDNVIVGLQSAFDNSAGNTDKKIPLYDFDTDGSGVTSVVDRRQLGKFVDAVGVSSESFDLPSEWSLTENNSGEVVIENSADSAILRWNESANEWVTNGIDVATIKADNATIGGVSVPEEIGDTRNAVNQLFIDNARQDFELGLGILEMDDGQFEVYANDNRIADQSNVDLNLGSPLDGKGTVSLASSATSGFTEHDKEDYGFLPDSVWITDDIDTNPTNGTIEYEIEDENGNVVTVTQSEVEGNVDVSGTIETYGVTTRAVLKRDTDGDTSPVLDAYSAYISGQTPDDYLEATVTGVTEA